MISAAAAASLDKYAAVADGDLLTEIPRNCAKFPIAVRRGGPSAPPPVPPIRVMPEALDRLRSAGAACEDIRVVGNATCAAGNIDRAGVMFWLPAVLEISAKLPSDAAPPPAPPVTTMLGAAGDRLPSARRQSHCWPGSARSYYCDSAPVSVILPPTPLNAIFWACRRR